MNKQIAAFAALGMVASAGAVGFSGGVYQENFDGMLGDETVSVNPDFSLPGAAGWYAPTQISYRVSDGTLSKAGLYSAGQPGSTDRALGIAQADSADFFFLALTNDTGITLNELQFDLFGEVWRLPETYINPANGQIEPNPGVMRATYRVGGAAWDDGAYSSLSALNVTSPTGVPEAQTPQNGNLNRQHLTTDLTGFNLLPGQTFWFRYDGVNGKGNDGLLAVDDLTITAPQAQPVPEPCTLSAAAFGLLLFARRRKTAV